MENNLVWNWCTKPTPVFTVDADSTSGTRLDYNVISALTDSARYSWAGTTYASATALFAATGQGAHDFVGKQRMGSGGAPAENTPAVDSGDATAPGVLPTDFFGNPPADDPLVANTGTGFGYLDRGAAEREDPMSVSIQLSAGQVSVGQALTVTITATQGWAPLTGYTVDFGDGTKVPVATNSTSATVSHVYSTASPYYGVSATANDALGNTSAPTPTISMTVS